MPALCIEMQIILEVLPTWKLTREDKGDLKPQLCLTEKQSFGSGFILTGSASNLRQEEKTATDQTII